MTDVTTIPEGVWGISRIIEIAPRSFATAAQVQGIGVCHAHYPPLNAAKDGYTLPFAIVHFPYGPTGAPDADTRTLPQGSMSLTLGELTGVQRTNLRNQLEEWLTAYQFVDWDSQTVVKAAFDGSGYTLTTTLATVMRDVFRHMGHSTFRAKPAAVEDHNTEYTDDFSTDPSSRWTAHRSASPTWDSGNGEYDMNTASGDSWIRYSANNPGSIEHESQHTFFLNGRVSQDRHGVAIRLASAADDAYHLVAGNQADSLYLNRYNAGTRSTIATFTGYTMANDEFHTCRLAASGTAGNNVVLDAWDTNHGASKPGADPGWLGTDGTPDDTYTDTSVDRLDDSTHIYCGIGWQGQGGDWDTQCDWFKERALTDRSGASSLAGARGYLCGDVMKIGGITG